MDPTRSDPSVWQQFGMSAVIPNAGQVDALAGPQQACRTLDCVPRRLRPASLGGAAAGVGDSPPPGGRVRSGSRIRHALDRRCRCWPRYRLRARDYALVKRLRSKDAIIFVNHGTPKLQPCQVILAANAASLGPCSGSGSSVNSDLLPWQAAAGKHRCCLMVPPIKMQ